MSAIYIFSADTRHVYKKELLQLISGKEKLFSWTAFIAAVHIDASNITNRMDHPCIWFEYKNGFELLNEEESNKKTTWKKEDIVKKTIHDTGHKSQIVEFYFILTDHMQMDSSLV